MGIEIPTVGGIDFFLKLAHFGHQRIIISIWIGHFLTYLVKTVDFFSDFAKSCLDVLADCFGFVQWRFLLEDAHGIAGGQFCIPVGNGFDAGHDFQQGRFTHAVRADHADFRAWQKAQGHVVKNHAVAVGFAGIDHLVNKLSQVFVPSF